MVLYDMTMNVDVGFSFCLVLLHDEEHLQKVLTRCKYPRWVLNRIKNKISAPAHSKDNKKKKNKNKNKKPTSNSSNSNIKRNYIVVQYTKGLTKSIRMYVKTMHSSIL